MAARRCPVCLINFPDNPEFNECEACKSETDRVQNARAMSTADARKHQRQFRWERFSVEWDESHDPSRLEPAYDPSIEERYGPDYFERVVREHQEAQKCAKVLEPENA